MSSSKIEKTKDETIAVRQANLPLHERHPVASDWQFAGASNVNVGSGSVENDIAYGNGGREGELKGPATTDSSARVDRKEWRSGGSTPPQVGELGGKGRQDGGNYVDWYIDRYRE